MQTTSTLDILHINLNRKLKSNKNENGKKLGNKFSLNNLLIAELLNSEVWSAEDENYYKQFLFCEKEKHEFMTNKWFKSGASKLIEAFFFFKTIERCVRN